MLRASSMFIIFDVGFNSCKFPLHLSSYILLIPIAVHLQLSPCIKVNAVRTPLTPRVVLQLIVISSVSLTWVKMDAWVFNTLRLGGTLVRINISWYNTLYLRLLPWCWIISAILIGPGHANIMLGWCIVLTYIIILFQLFII